MSTTSIRSKIDNEIARHCGGWFTVRQIQDKLKVNMATLKPLIMKYARESLLKRRKVNGTARSVQFTPASNNTTKFQAILQSRMPYREATATKNAKASKKATKTAKKTTRKTTTKKNTSKSRR